MSLFGTPKLFSPNQNINSPTTSSSGLFALRPSALSRLGTTKSSTTQSSFSHLNTSGFGTSGFGTVTTTNINSPQLFNTNGFGSGAAQTGSLFNSSFSNPVSTSLFSGSLTQSNNLLQSNLSNFTTNKPAFGAFGINSTGFGAPASAIATGFGAPVATVATGFGAPVATVATGFGVAVSTVATGFFGFGNQQNQSSFGFNADQQTNKFGFANSSQNLFNISNSGNNLFSFLGSTTQSSTFPQLQQQQQLQICRQNPIDLFFSSLSQPLLFGDERDPLLARWNQLQAMWGTGIGYSALGAVNYSVENTFSRFKAIGYNVLPTSIDSDGLVCLFLNRSFDDVMNQRQSVQDILFRLLGGRPNLQLIIEEIRPCTDFENSTEVIFRVVERLVTGKQF